jgi:hypothetical protein
MTHYGVRRLVIINSGNYGYANADVSKPVHLAAPNNRGKSTLVNALQFLYVNDFKKMRFPRRTHDDTAMHYFGRERSYLVFECTTLTGIQCMVISGLSRIGDGRFERYVYEGQFQESDYFEENDEVRSFDVVRSILADRNLIQVKSSDLWRVLGNPLNSEDRVAEARLNILPFRREDDYLVFRNVYVQLLSLANANAEELRRLIIDTYVRETSDRRIDIAAEYSKDFAVAEQSERRHDFIISVAESIDTGKDLREELGAITKKLKMSVPVAWSDAQRCKAFLREEEQCLCVRLSDLKREHLRAQAEEKQCLTVKGELRVKLNAVEKAWNELIALHEKWSAISDAFINLILDNAKLLMVKISDHERILDQAEKFQATTLQRRVSELKQKINSDQKAFQHWDRTAVAELRRLSLSDAELDSAFRVANPAFLNLIVGESLTIKDAKALIGRIRLLAGHVADGTYTDDTISANVAEFSGPISLMAANPEELRRQINLNTTDLEQAEMRLAACNNQEQMRATLESLREEHRARQRETDEYERYRIEWSRRAELEAELASHKTQVTNNLTKISELEAQTKAHEESIARTEADLLSLKGVKDNLTEAARRLHEDLERLHMDFFLPTLSESPTDDLAGPHSLLEFASAVRARLVSLAQDVRRTDECHAKLKHVQDRIAEQARGYEGQVYIFSDPEDDWRALIEARESIPQIEEVTKKHWDSLFTTLGARLNLIVTAVRRIKTAVDGINRGLKSYQVSNLLAVNISVEEAHDTFPAIEALAGANSLFHDPGQVELAKKKLRRMINSNEIIELHSLFELRIEIQEMDGTRHQAKSLDEIGSTGTGLTAKAMIFIHLVRAIADSDKYRLHFYIDGLGEFDDPNLSATIEMAVSKGMVPITADPRLHVEALAHPEVTVYSLGQNSERQYFIDQYRTYYARLSDQTAPTAPNTIQ